MPVMLEIGGTLFAALAVAGRVCVGLVFFLAGVEKLRHWRLLPGVIGNYRLLPRWAAAPASALLPVMELFVALALLSGQGAWWPAAVAVTLLAIFALAMAINIARGRTHIDCGCGRTFLAQELSWALVARNMLLAGLLLPSLIGPAAVALADVWTGAATGLGFFLLYLLFNAFSALRPLAARRFA